MNELKEGQIYTLNDGETYDVIHEHFYDGSGSWCYEIIIMMEIKNESGQIVWPHDLIGYSIEWEDCSIDLIKEKGILVGELGKTHFFNPDNGHRLEEL